MEILEAYDLTGSYRAAAELAGCDHHTVARYVKMRAAGQPPAQPAAPSAPDRRILEKIEELVAARRGRSARMSSTGGSLRWGSPAGTHHPPRGRRGESPFRAGRRRVYRPWVTEPGLWLQWDWGEGPRLSAEDHVVVRLAGLVAVSGW